MGKKKRKRSGKNKGFAVLGNLIGGTFRLFFRSIPFALVFGTAGMLFVGVRQALYADFSLTLEKIIVTPPDALSATERRGLETRLIGNNILTIDIQKISRDLKKNPEIRVAKVSRYLPSLLKIEVEERKPMAFVQFAPKGYYGVAAEDGMILEVVKERNTSLVLVEAYSLGLKEPRVGSQIKHRGFVEAMTFLKAFWKDPLAHQENVTKIGLDHLGNVGIVLGSGPDIRLGRRPAEHLNDLEKIMPILHGDGRLNIDYIDLQFDNVIVKRKK